MSHVETRGPGRYVAVYANPANKSGKGAKSFRKKGDAHRFLAVTDAAQLRNEWVDPKAGRVTVRDYSAAWLATRGIRATTRVRYIRYVAIMCESWADFPMASIRPAMVRAWQAVLCGQMATSTAGTIRGVAAGMFKDAIRDRVITTSPFDDVRAPKVTKTLIQPMARSTVLAIRDDITANYRAAVALGAGTGVRRGECMGLTVDRVDFLRRVVTVDRQLIGADGDAPVFGPPKTPASVRRIPLPQAVVDELARHIARFPLGTDGLLFTSPRGGPVTRSKFGATWSTCKATPAGSRFHWLRHFYASTLIEGGASVKVVQARLGHATAAETLDTYAHLWPDSEDDTRRLIDAAFAASSVDSAAAK